MSYNSSIPNKANTVSFNSPKQTINSLRAGMEPQCLSGPSTTTLPQLFCWVCTGLDWASNNLKSNKIKNRAVGGGGGGGGRGRQLKQLQHKIHWGVYKNRKEMGQVFFSGQTVLIGRGRQDRLINEDVNLRTRNGRMHYNRLRIS